MPCHRIRKFILHEIPVEMTLAYLQKKKGKKHTKLSDTTCFAIKDALLRTGKTEQENRKMQRTKMNANLNTAHSSQF